MWFEAILGFALWTGGLLLLALYFGKGDRQMLKIIVTGFIGNGYTEPTWTQKEMLVDSNLDELEVSNMVEQQYPKWNKWQYAKEGAKRC